MNRYPQDRDARRRMLSAHLHLLDRQVLDVDGTPVSTVDDLEISDIPLDTPLAPGSPAPAIHTLLAGPVLATRIFGGHTPRSRWERIAWRDVADIGTAISLTVAGETLDVTWLERWLRDHVIARIPRGRHDPE